MTTQLISIEFGTRSGHVGAFACPATGVLPRVRTWLVEAGVADQRMDKFTGVSVPGCRGVT